MKRLLKVNIVILLLIFHINTFAQCLYDQTLTSTVSSVYESKNGVSMPTSGTVRILVVPCEVNYTSGITDPTGPAGTTHWPAHSLPDWLDNSPSPVKAFDVNVPTGTATGLFTRYFQEASFGNLNIIADVLINNTNGGMWSVNSADGVANYSTIIPVINSTLSSLNTLNGHNNITDFDQWQMTGAGVSKINSSDSPNQFDHVMFIWRNDRGSGGQTIDGQGFTSTNCPSMLGFTGNTFSNFSIYDALEVNIMRHEFSHLLYGGNNMHVSGGIGLGYPNYWIPVESAYSILSLSDGTLNCWNGWDRRFMGWRPSGSNPSLTISARNQANTAEVNGDLDPSNPLQAGIYTLRDFVSTGDAIRIKLPFIASSEYPEWIWLENHNGQIMNGSPFDKWQYEGNCVQASSYGLYCYTQIDKDVITSSDFHNLYAGNCDYIRSISAEGCYDRELSTSNVLNTCLNVSVKSFTLLPQNKNPLTGGGDNDQIPIDKGQTTDQLDNGDSEPNDSQDLGLGNYLHSFPQNGHNRQIFT